jgi:hypothetical protein
MFLSSWRFFRQSAGAKNSQRPAARRPSVRPQLEALEPRWVPAGYGGPVIHAMNYSPTWHGWNPHSLPPAFFDSDFAHDGAAALWGRVKNGKPDLNLATNKTDGSRGRNDLATIAAKGFNLVRLYDWGPSRTNAGGPKDGAHLNFLKYAYSLKPNDGYSHHLKVIVPVSAYFLSNDHFAWAFANSEGYTDPVKDGKVSYDLDAAPQSIQDDLADFIASITVTNPDNGAKSISPAVFAISVGNEIEGTFQDQQNEQKYLMPTRGKIDDTDQQAPNTVNAASKLARAEWWMVNVERELAKITGGDKVRLTVPVSTADLGPEGPLSWFKAFIDGVKLGDTVPHATHNGDSGGILGGTFNFTFVAKDKGGQALPPVTGSIPGLASLTGLRPYDQWFFNTYQAYQNPQGFKNIFQQYDSGGTNSPYQWPGRQKLNVPLLILEMGLDRNQRDDQVPPNDKGRAVNLTAKGQQIQHDKLMARAEAMEEYLKEHEGQTEAMGYTLFEFNDEVGRKSGSEAVFGAEMMADTQPEVSLEGHYPKATLLFEAKTNAQKFAGGDINSGAFPVQELFPVKGKSRSLLDDLQTLFEKDAHLRS